MTDWSGEDYAKISSLQRAMIDEAKASLALADGDCVLDVGCGDGHLIRKIAGMVPAGCAIGVDPSKRMIATAHSAGTPTKAGPWFVIADARRLPFGEHFDVVVSFNALHWVPEQRQALQQIASALRPAGRVLIQVVCAGERPSLEAVAMKTCQSPRWASWFDGFAAPFIHVEPNDYGELASSAGLALTKLTVTDREWNYGSRNGFERWCAVGCTAWTDRLPVEDRGRFIDELVEAYEPVAGRPGLSGSPRCGPNSAASSTRDHQTDPGKRPDRRGEQQWDWNAGLDAPRVRVSPPAVCVSEAERLGQPALSG